MARACIFLWRVFRQFLPFNQGEFMNKDIIDSVVSRLQQDYQLRQKGAYLREGVCPECQKKELFISATEPHNLKCGRENHCGWSCKTRDLYPDLFQTLAERYPATSRDPHATAKAYLKYQRGIDPALLAGQFEQGQRYEQHATSEPNSTDTVRFFLSADKSVWWERFITPIETREKPKKSHFNGKFKGQWWQPSGFNPQRGERVFLVEGVLDALSLIQSGFKAVALMTSGNWPDAAIQAHLGQGVQWVLGLDNDKTGKRYNLEFFNKLEQLGERVEVCLAPDKDKRDWNDLLKASGGRILDKDLSEWFQTGKLLTATSAKQKALIIAAHTGKNRFTFDHGDKLYAAKYSEKDEDEPITLEQIANCKPEFLYFQKDILTGEGAYYLSITRPQNGKPYKEVFTSSALASAKEFKSRLMDVGAGLMFTGNTKQLEHHQQAHWFNTATLPEVQTINFLGYSKEVQGWIFPQLAVFAGQLHTTNDNDFFELADGRHVKTTFRQQSLKLGKPDDAHRPDLWFEDFKSAFGVKGLAALAYWTGSYFAEQIREQQASYPFLELSGEPGTGKSTLLEFLWKLTGRENYEGIELAKATHAARWRSLEQLANLPLVMIEGDSGQGGHQRRTFDLNEVKPLYNGRGLRGTAPKNQGIETHEPNFRGALVIAQNAMVESDLAVMERITRIHWDKSHFSTDGYHASARLRALDIEQINGYMMACIVKEQDFLSTYQANYSRAMEQLDSNQSLGNQRIRHNHAQLMAIAHTLKATGLLDLTADDLTQLDAYLMACCNDRHECLSADTPLVAEFWDNYEYMEHDQKRDNDAESFVNHLGQRSGRVAINLKHFEEKAAEQRLKPLDMMQLRRELRNSKRYPFIEQKAVWSVVFGKTVKCYVFHLPEKGEEQAEKAA